MSQELSSFWLAIGAMAGLFAIGIWFVFVRPVPPQSAVGVITQKTFKPANTYPMFDICGLIFSAARWRTTEIPWFASWRRCIGAKTVVTTLCNL